MAEDWGLASLIVALCALTLTLSPVSLGFIASVISPILSTIWPSLGKCETFEWTDIPDGALHTCEHPPQSCSHVGAQITPESWEAAASHFFAFRRGNFVRKPKQLSLTTRYIRTDTKTLKAFLSLLNGHALYETGRSFQIVFKPVGGLTTAYVKIQRGLPNSLNHFCRLDVTKREMELIFQGYPPWYQNPLSVGRGRHVTHPIIDESDLHRGGWIFAVGLSPTRPTLGNFLEIKGGSMLIVERGLRRVIRCLKNLELAFYGELRVSAAHTLVEGLHWWYAVGGGYGPSRARELFYKAGFKDLLVGPDFIEGLTDSQIITGMKVFNYDEPLTDKEITQLRPVLESVVRASVLGVRKVIDHVGIPIISTEEIMPCSLPPELTNDGYVYVRERWDSLED
ncbi:uncharacterized protein HMPREF1541_02734 [Cyphellophora europaea CBS 101466]|uniref:Uncharacterized protein n=1 Tax=Cyphellophora europaea (strain CBS 101466) TaxID=1220924 RepID=W2S4Q2_CYPE1|nr:uncharacterized protein HMPREF1541_02734 [Cyphellophora europaea CBS 101466]ETN43575.1 hypothetical protein HMPREF1541_02734 [Cyphellophora europaea CBS 101466]